jgi:hypothetical protein
MVKLKKERAITVVKMVDNVLTSNVHNTALYA